MSEELEIKEEATDILNVLEGDPGIIDEIDRKIVTEIPVEELPSGFKGYPKGTRISYEPITLAELEALNSGNMIAAKAIAMLLKAIHCNTLKSQDLYYWDVIYIGIKRKLLAFGDTTGMVNKLCPTCGSICSKKFKYTELEFKELLVPDLPMTMELCGQKLKFGLISMKNFLQMKLEDGAAGVYASYVQNMPYKDALDLIKSAYGADLKKLKFVEKQLDYGLKPFHVKCVNVIDKPNENFNPDKPESAKNKKFIKEMCNEDVVLEVRSPFEVVFPEDTFEEFNDIQVQYGE